MTSIESSTMTDKPASTDGTESKPKYYLTNAQLLPEVIKSKEQGQITDKLARMLMLLTQRIAYKPSFVNYTYRDDMVSEALADLCKNALKFNAERSNNPFAFYTTCVTNSFLGYLNHEKKHRRIRDQLLVELGENPSYSFQEEWQEQIKNGMGAEVHELTTEIAEARKRQAKEAATAAKQEAVADTLLEFDSD
jgi:DNA-directed RNA polymerase specialized sigma24 family protein